MISANASLIKDVHWRGNRCLLTLIYMGGGGQICPPGSFYATAQKRLALDCSNFVAFIISLLPMIWYTIWSQGLKLLPW